jgi:hypothetical protein
MQMAAHTLPEGYLWLGDAFEQIWREIEDGRRLALEAERQVPCPETSAAFGGNWTQCDPTAVEALNNSRSRVEKMMRTALANGRLHAFIRDAKTGQPGELANREAWWEKISFGVPGLSTVLHHLTCPGPETDGRPVFLPTGEVEGFIMANSPATGVIARGDLIAETPWTLPIAATPDRVNLLGETIWLPLSPVVSFLAFGEADAPEGMEPYVEANYRGRAADALFAASGQGRVRLFGACSLGGPPSIIPEAVFVGPLALADDGTSFDIALGPAPFPDFVRAREGKPDSRRWSNVTVERASLVSWIAELARGGAQTLPRNRLAGKVCAVSEAVAALWPNGIEAGISEKTRDASIRRWLRDNGRDDVGDRTIDKALSLSR